MWLSEFFFSLFSFFSAKLQTGGERKARWGSTSETARDRLLGKRRNKSLCIRIFGGVRAFNYESISSDFEINKKKKKKRDNQCYLMSIVNFTRFPFTNNTNSSSWDLKFYFLVNVCTFFNININVCTCDKETSITFVLGKKQKKFNKNLNCCLKI